MGDFVEQIVELPNGQVKVDFRKTDGTYTLQDAIYYSKEEYDSLTEAEIEAEKTRRFDNWVAVITAPSVENPDAQIVTETPPFYTESNPTVVSSSTLVIGEETYAKLEGVPQSGAKLIEVNGVWYYKV